VHECPRAPFAGGRYITRSTLKPSRSIFQARPRHITEIWKIRSCSFGYFAAFAATGVHRCPTGCVGCSARTCFFDNSASDGRRAVKARDGGHLEDRRDLSWLFWARLGSSRGISAVSWDHRSDGYFPDAWGRDQFGTSQIPFFYWLMHCLVAQNTTLRRVLINRLFMTRCPRPHSRGIAGQGD